MRLVFRKNNSVLKFLTQILNGGWYIYFLIYHPFPTYPVFLLKYATFIEGVWVFGIPWLNCLY